MCSRSRIIKHSSFASSAEKALIYLSTTEIVPNIIFVDLHMPKMNGFQFIEKYEEHFAPKFSRTALFVLSSSTRESDKNSALGYSSVKDFLIKPLTEAKLEGILMEYLGHHQ